jgi:carboxymethylenebutenolidase
MAKTGSAGAEAGPMSEKIRLANGLEGVLFRPAAGAGRDAVIVLHERYGLVQHTLDLAQKLARDGYVAFAPNLFAGWRGDAEALKRGSARAKVPDDECARIVGLAIDLLRADPRTRSEKIFLMGVCQSGRYPIVVASRRADVAACVVFYGAAQQRDWEASELQPLAMPGMIAAVAAPSLFVFGEADHVISLEHVLRLRDALESNRKSYRMRVIAKAPHGFLNDTMPGRYRPREAALAWDTLRVFLAEVGAGKWPPERVRWEFECDSGDDYDFGKNMRLE